MKQTKPKHTNGPWQVDTTGMYLQIRGNLSDRKHMAHEEVVARVYHLDDAALIAAAPEMLEALEAMQTLASSDVTPSIELVSRVRNMAVAAIAKAKGGAG